MQYLLNDCKIVTMYGRCSSFEPFGEEDNRYYHDPNIYYSRLHGSITYIQPKNKDIKDCIIDFMHDSNELVWLEFGQDDIPTVVLSEDDKGNTLVSIFAESLCENEKEHFRCNYFYLRVSSAEISKGYGKIR